MLKTLFVAAALATLQPASPAPDLSKADNGRFGAMMFVTDDVDGFWKAWKGPTPPNISTTSKVTQARPVHAMIVLAGCAPGADGNCNVSVSFSITGPDGSAYDEPVSGKAWSRPPAPGRNPVASLSSLGFQLEPQDKLGPYRIVAKITDEVAGESLTISETIVAEAN